MRLRLLNWLVIYGGIVLLALGALAAADAPPIRAQGQQYVGLIIEFGDGTEPFKECIPYKPGMNGIDVLKSSALSSNLELDPGFGTLGSGVCAIDDQGCFVSQGEACFCKCQGSSCNYWSYYHLVGGAWQYSDKGASTYAAQPGGVEGWSWGAGKPGSGNTPSSGTPPPQTSFADLCAAVVTATATATTNAAATATTGATSSAATATPTLTPAPTQSSGGGSGGGTGNPYEGTAPSPTPPLRPTSGSSSGSSATQAPTTAVPATAAPSATRPAQAAPTQTSAAPAPTRAAATQAPATQAPAAQAQATTVAPSATSAPTPIPPTETAPATLPPVPTAASGSGSVGKPALDSSASPTIGLIAATPARPAIVKDATSIPVVQSTQPAVSLGPTPRAAGQANPEKPASSFDPLPYLAFLLILGGLGKVAYDAMRRRRSQE